MDLLDWHLHPDAVWQQAVERAVWHRRHPGYTDAARGKSLGLVFFNNSLRTRLSMELAAAQLGAHPTTLDVGQGVWGFAWNEGVVMDGAEAEHISEAVGVLSRYYDALGVRVFATLKDRARDDADALLQTFASHAAVPVVNLESARFHPCQALADAALLHERFAGDAKSKKFVLTWAPHPRALPRAVPHSALLMAARLGFDVTLAHPPGFSLDDEVVGWARQYAEARGATFTQTDDAGAAFDGADVVYAKAWAAPLVYTDPDAEAGQRAALAGWRVTPEKMQRTREAAFMHCLPVRRGVVVDDAVLDGPHAVHLDQAEYRLHAQKAILEMMWGLEA